jgi:hypothetical protein
MAKEKLFPKAPADDKREPHDKFSDFAQKIVTVPKSEVDAREQAWRTSRSQGQHSSPKRHDNDTP